MIHAHENYFLKYFLFKNILKYIFFYFFKLFFISQYQNYLKTLKKYKFKTKKIKNSIIF